MTEPTRDALHAETLRWLSLYQDTLVESEETCSAYAAECVRKRAKLEAEVERLRADRDRLDAIEAWQTQKRERFNPYITALGSGYVAFINTFNGGIGRDASGETMRQAADALRAAATREGTPEDCGDGAK